MTWGAGALVGALAAGRAFEVAGPDGMPWLLGALLFAFGLVLAALLPRHLRDSTPHEKKAA
jgi:hypothetical protein